MNLLSSASVFGFYTLVSRVLGYLRDILIAVFLGTSVYADAFFVAFKKLNTSSFLSFINFEEATISGE